MFKLCVQVWTHGMDKMGVRAWTHDTEKAVCSSVNTCYGYIVCSSVNTGIRQACILPHGLEKLCGHHFKLICTYTVYVGGIVIYGKYAR